MSRRVFFVAVILASFGVGCGHNYQGTYVGQEQITMQGTTVPAVSSTISITQNSNDVANISWNGAGTLTAQVVDGTNLRINAGTLAPLSTATLGSYNPAGYPPGYNPAYPSGYNPTYPNGYPTNGAVTTCNVTGGTGVRNGDVIQFSLQLAVPQVATGAYVYNPCPTGRGGSFTKQK